MMDVQLVYDPSGWFGRLRSRLNLSLGMWHAYKHLLLSCFKQYAGTVVVRLFHKFYPSRPFFASARFLSQVLNFSWDTSPKSA
jgi:hypothetical protein